MHGAGKPDKLKDIRDKLGWDKSEIVMFPIIGKPKDNVVRMQGHDYSMDQHGISRAIPFIVDATDGLPDLAMISQLHDGGSVANPKYKGDSSSPERLEWPAYSIDKLVQVLRGKVSVMLAVQNLTASPMSYRLGWHPAFRLQGANDDAVFTFANPRRGSSELYMKDVIEASASGAYFLPDVGSVQYVDRKTCRGVRLVFGGFNNAMLWTKSADSGMFCIEPVTQLPDKNREYLDDVGHESLGNYEIREYSVDILPLGS
jgi:galactose mutarotase-like enzyme